MKKVIVITTINHLTEAVRKFDRIKGWHLVVVGDLQTPKGYRLTNGTYLPPRWQESYDKELSDAIGWNCPQRRNFGLLWARDHGAELVAMSDDDNIPTEEWGSEIIVGKEKEVWHHDTRAQAFDPVGAAGGGRLWHRGFPIQLVAQRKYAPTKKKVKADVQAGFWNGDPDVDAVCRMLYHPEIEWADEGFPLASNKMGPFNSQNTILDVRWLKEYFMFPAVGRQDDIWAAYYLQAKGAKVVWTRPTVYQRRNEHNLTEDLRQECLGYIDNLRLVEALTKSPQNIVHCLPQRALQAWVLYRRHFK